MIFIIPEEQYPGCILVLHTTPCSLNTEAKRKICLAPVNIVVTDDASPILSDNIFASNSFINEENLLNFF